MLWHWRWNLKKESQNGSINRKMAHIAFRKYIQIGETNHSWYILTWRNRIDDIDNERCQSRMYDRNAFQVYQCVPLWECSYRFNSGWQQVVDIIASHPDHDIIIGIDTLGKEDLLLHISQALKIKVWQCPSLSENISFSPVDYQNGFF